MTTAVMALEHLGMPPEVAGKLGARKLVLPPLRGRPDEMSFLVHDAVRGAEPALQIHSTLIEACLLRPWPGNSRELVTEVSRPAHTVADQGKNNIRGEDLDNDAGHLMVGAPTLNAAVQPTAVGNGRKKRSSTRPSGRSEYGRSQPAQHPIAKSPIFVGTWGRTQPDSRRLERDPLNL